MPVDYSGLLLAPETKKHALRIQKGRPFVAIRADCWGKNCFCAETVGFLDGRFDVVHGDEELDEILSLQWRLPDSSVNSLFGSGIGSAFSHSVFCMNGPSENFGKSFPKTDPILVRTGKRYRLKMDNQSDEAHPIHLHRHSFELINVAGKPTGGILKDVVVVPANSVVEADLVADNPGLTLFHCHQQLHMDYGFMTLVKYAD